VGTLRVIGGEKRGFPLASPKGGRLRPTGNRVREALFDILGDRVRDSRFLDLFAGTGAVGIEALSRGAASCLFVEGDSRNIRMILDNLRLCHLEGSAEIQEGSLPRCLSRLEGRRRVDLVFVDPPYDTGQGELVLNELGLGNLVREGAWVILEHRKSTRLPTQLGSLGHMRTVRYGDTALSFFERAKAVSLSAERD
jgi:16S rRNA (guanine966-N2)-methyltransferase